MSSWPEGQGSWTYDPKSPLSNKDKVRMHSGDTNPLRPLISDEEILMALSEEPTLHLAAAMVCEMIAAKYAGSPSGTGGGVSKQRDQVFNMYMKKAEKLRSMYSFDAIPSVSGGISESDDEAITGDTDVPDFAFSKGQFDDPLANPAYIEEED